MNIQAQLKYQIIIDTLNRSFTIGAQIAPEHIEAVFNIPLQDAKAILKQWKASK